MGRLRATPIPDHRRRRAEGARPCGGRMIAANLRRGQTDPIPPTMKGTLTTDLRSAHAPRDVKHGPDGTGDSIGAVTFHFVHQDRDRAGRRCRRSIAIRRRWRTSRAAPAGVEAEGSPCRFGPSPRGKSWSLGRGPPQVAYAPGERRPWPSHGNRRIVKRGSLRGSTRGGPSHPRYRRRPLPHRRYHAVQTSTVGRAA